MCNMVALLLRVAPRLASQLGRVDHHRPVLMQRAEQHTYAVWPVLKASGCALLPTGEENKRRHLQNEPGARRRMIDQSGGQVDNMHGRVKSIRHSGLATDEFILCYLFLIFIILKKYV
jgi:hypothetical protein